MAIGKLGISKSGFGAGIGVANIGRPTILPPSSNIVTNLAVASITTTSASVSWNPPIQGTGYTYKVELSTNGGASYSTVNANATSPQALTGSAGVAAIVRVTATNATSTAATTTNFSFASVVPSAVVGLTNGSVTTSGATITWSAPVTGTTPFTYLVEISLNAGANYTTLTTNGTSPYPVTGLSPGQAAIVRVSAANPAGVYGPTQTTGFTTTALSPTITVNTPSGVVVGTPVVLTGTYANYTPTALDAQLNSTGGLIALTSFSTDGAGNWTGTLAAYGAAATGQTIKIQDHTTTTITATTGTFTVSAATVPASITVATPSGVVAGTPVVLIGTYAGTGYVPAAMDAQLNSAGVLIALTSFSASGGTWSGTLTAYSAAATGQTVKVQDHTTTTITATTGTFSVAASGASNDNVTVVLYGFNG